MLQQHLLCSLVQKINAATIQNHPLLDTLLIIPIILKSSVTVSQSAVFNQVHMVTS